MRNLKFIGISVLISFLFVCLIWQIAEPKIVSALGKACYAISHRSFIELTTYDKSGLPMRYYPGAGTFYDPELIAREASRYYDTRIEPQRLQAFIAESDWLLAHCDSTGVIAQAYDFPPAKLTQPWLSAPANTAAMLAIAKRAGYDRDTRKLVLAKRMLANIRKAEASSAYYNSDGLLWLKAYPAAENDLQGMLRGLSDLAEFYKIAGDSIAGNLFNQGIKNLTTRLPQVEKKGYLEDEYSRLGQRADHRQLTQLLSDTSYATPDSIFKPNVLRYQAKDRIFVVTQMLVRPRFGRICGFLVAWLLSFLLVYAFLRVPRKNLTI
ncbi:MAG: hypothetical protein RBS43_09005 [Candidatus Cloacimonas sp.]|jgi:hypothetical protein|nr:hypothetical protein [Candidatus Cloacimonas sp.]